MTQHPDILALRERLKQTDDCTAPCPKCAGVMRLRTADCPKGLKVWVCDNEICGFVEIMEIWE